MFDTLVKWIRRSANQRTALADMGQRQEGLRKRLAELEARVEAVRRQLAKIEPSAENLTPMLSAVMREGIPLEIFTRLALIEAGYTVAGHYPFKYYNLDGTWIERSVDIYGTKDRTYTVPPDSGRRSGQSWPERAHLVVEAKQRRRGVTWVFCELPTSAPQKSGPSDVPTVNFGFELRPGEQSPRATGNTKDVENGLAQLQYAYLPKLVEIEVAWHEDHKNVLGYHRLSEGTRRDSLWNLLVTNARLMLFRQPTALAQLEGEPSPRDDDLFIEAPWLIFQGEPTLHLVEHQSRHAATIRSVVPDADKSLPTLLTGKSAQIHVVNYDHLADFLGLVADPPRIKQIVINLSINGRPSAPITIK
jgi:hypothetical protein